MTKADLAVGFLPFAVDFCFNVKARRARLVGLSFEFQSARL